MTKLLETTKEVLGGLFFFTYERKLLIIGTIIALISTICYFVSKSFQFYGLHLDQLETTLSNISTYMFQMWVYDALALVSIALLGLYINETVRYFSTDRKSLLDKLVERI